jgi:hypothetical protein
VTNSWTSVAPPPGWTNIGDAASEVLPDGTFMLQHPCNTCVSDPDPTVDDALLNAKTLSWTVYAAGGTPNPSWRPSISALSSTALAPGGTYALSGTQLAGLDQGAVYGDDVQDSTNFPLVRITNSATGVVTYARTSDWTSVSVAPGTRSSTRFTLPPGTPAGMSTLVVVAHGIPSPATTVTIR